jgi:hypothetical protein
MGVIENAKEIADIVKKIGDIDLYRKIVALEGEVLDLTRANRELEGKVRELEQTLDFGQALTFHEPFYFVEGDKTPYCAPCWELKHEGVHVAKVWASNGETRWDCPICKNMCVVNSSHLGYRPY